ncbi:MAG: FAD-dependent thymidylate synthase [Sulfurimonas sp.]|nr:FAD-dependent thymidylate synthase [Sulfurimonas sp.]
MKVKLIMSTPEIQIGEMAKICYASKEFAEGGKDITSSIVHGNGHLASLRFAYATLSIEGISVACQNQFIRSPHLSYMVQSKRYVNADKGEFEFIMPIGIDEVSAITMKKSWDQALHDYQNILNLGTKKEDARAILPANTSTKMNATGNLQAWNDFFKLRLNAHAQTEIRNVANEIYTLLSVEFPQVFTKEHKLNLEEGELQRVKKELSELKKKFNG